jgi:hypothetical protein
MAIIYNMTAATIKSIKQLHTKQSIKPKASKQSNKPHQNKGEIRQAIQSQRLKHRQKIPCLNHRKKGKAQANHTPKKVSDCLKIKQEIKLKYFYVIG